MKYQRSDKGLRKANKFNNSKIFNFGLDLDALQTVVADEKSSIDPIVVKIEADIKKYNQYLAIIEKAKIIEPQIKKRVSALEKSKKTIIEAKQPNIIKPRKQTVSTNPISSEKLGESSLKYKEEFYKKDSVEKEDYTNTDTVEKKQL